MRTSYAEWVSLDNYWVDNPQGIGPVISCSRHPSRLTSRCSASPRAGEQEVVSLKRAVRDLDKAQSIQVRHLKHFMKEPKLPESLGGWLTC